MNELLIFLLIFVVMNVILYLMLLFILKGVNPFKLLKISFVTSILIICILTCVMYFNDVSYESIAYRNNYIVGRIVSVDKNGIKVKMTNHNLNTKFEDVKDSINIKIIDETVIRKQKGLFEKSSNKSDLKSGDHVAIICIGGNVDNNKSITAQKITIK